MAEDTASLGSQRLEIESFIVDWMTDSHVPGVSVAIVTGDGTVYSEGFGARHLATNEPATAHTLYGVGSCTKPFTALAVLQLVARETVERDDTVTEYVSVLSETSDAPITVAQLLTHTSGIPSDDLATVLIPRMALGGGPEVPLSSRSDFERHVDGAVDRRVTDGEEQFMYYNSGYVILGQLIESVTGQPYPAYVREHILDPLGMERSTFEREMFEADSDTMTPYYRDDEGSQASEIPFDEFIHAAGGLLSSVTEMASFLSFQMGDTDTDPFGVDREVLTTMAQPRATMRQYLDGTEIGYGYGWMTQPLLDDTLVGHGGSTGVSGAYLGWLQDENIGVAIACNCAPEPAPMEIGKGVLALLHGTTPERTVPALMLREKYATVTGEYTSYRGLQTATVEREGQSLQLTQETSLGAQTLQLIPERLAPDDYTFYTVTADGARISVEFNTDTEPVELSFDRARFEKQ